MLLFYTDIDFTTMEVLYRLFKKTFYFVTFHCSHKQTKQSLGYWCHTISLLKLSLDLFNGPSKLIAIQIVCK